MLVDILADSLPNRKKRRWHFNTFMLETLARLEQLRQSRSRPGAPDGDSEHSLIWLAKDMIEKSPILFLDEFQLPDRAASKILSNLFTAFFRKSLGDKNLPMQTRFMIISLSLDN
jgi:predicted ATPase